MAEFQEVCRQALRMGEALNAEYSCPMTHVGLFITSEGEVKAEDGKTAVTPDVLERYIMKWAAEHPEPKYPSWHEAWKQLFPEGQGSPCPAAYDMRYEWEKCGVDCKGCKDRPIPADIAEKLGIKPIKDEAQSCG